MLKRIIERLEIPLPMLSPRSESSLRVIDLVKLWRFVNWVAYSYLPPSKEVVFI